MMVPSREDVLEPDVWHRPATYWFWHHVPHAEEIRAQIDRMHRAGFGSFQIQARLSFPQSEYLDDRYLAACRIAVEAAAARGMVVGIYDDYNWQTGHAAGRAVADHDELRERHLFWADIDLATGRGRISGIRSATENLGPAAMAWHYERSAVEWTDWRVEHTIVERTGGAVDEDLPQLKLLGSADGAVLTAPVSELQDAVERVTVLVSARCATSRLVNPLDPSAVDRFVQAGLEPFRSALGEWFGGTVQYVFFDQPHAVYYDWAERDGQLGSAMPWHSSLDALLRDQWGDELPLVLRAVLRGSSTDDLARRCAFYEVFSRRAMAVFLGTLRDWAHRNGLRQSGHEVLSHVGSWTPGASFDNWDLRVNFGLDHFGVDAYRDLTAVDAQDAVSQLSPKLGDAVARRWGRTGTLVEQYFMTPPDGGAPWSGHWGLTLEELRATAIRHHLQGMRQMIFHGFTQTDGHGDDTASLINPRFDFPPGLNFEPWFDEHHADYARESGRLSAFLDGVREPPRIALLWPLRTIWTDGVTSAGEEFGTWAQALWEADLDFDIVDESELLDGAARLREDAVVILPAVRTLRSAATLTALRGRRVVFSSTTPAVYQEGAQTAPTDFHGLDAVRSAPGDAVLVANLCPAGDRPPFTLVHGAGLRSRWGHVGDEVRMVLYADGDEAVRVRLDRSSGDIEDWDALSGDISREVREEFDIQPDELRMLVRLASSDAPETPPATEWGPATTLNWTLELGGQTGPADTDRGWQIQYPTGIGVGRYRTVLHPASAVDHLLDLPAVAGSAELFVDGVSIGRRGWAPFSFRIPAERLDAQSVQLEIAVASPAANHYYAGTGLRAAPEPAGLLAPPLVRAARPTEEH